MNDRLQELLRQRSLVQEHLAWIDKEIIAASGVAAPFSGIKTPVPPIPSAPVSTPSAPSVSGVEAATAEEIDPLLAEYREEPEVLAADVKRGCFIYFSVGMAVMFVTVFLIYLHYVNRAPPPAPAPASKTIAPK